jgi:ABC-type nitrate/sulfonate/bicarbonate transport system substrate-binding protein
MAAVRAGSALLLLAFLAATFGGCADSKTKRTGELTDLSDLEGKTVGVTSLLSTTTLAARYVLQESYGLTAGPVAGDVTLEESPAGSLSQRLLDREIDAAIAAGVPSLDLADDEELVAFARVTGELRDITGEPLLTSVLLTYPDVADVKGAALADLNRMLETSVTYFESNRNDVLAAVAADRGVSRRLLERWWDVHDVSLGRTSAGSQEELLTVWRAATALGDIDAYPELSDVLFAAGEQSAPQGRTTISIALLDDASRRAALYAIEQGIVGSGLIDVNVTYLPLSALSEAALARQYDVFEAEPLAVPLAAESGQGFIVLSAGFVDLDSTLAFSRVLPGSD